MGGVVPSPGPVTVLLRPVTWAPSLPPSLPSGGRLRSGGTRGPGALPRGETLGPQPAGSNQGVSVKRGSHVSCPPQAGAVGGPCSQCHPRPPTSVSFSKILIPRSVDCARRLTVGPGWLGEHRTHRQGPPPGRLSAVCSLSTRGFQIGPAWSTSPGGCASLSPTGPGFATLTSLGPQSLPPQGSPVLPCLSVYMRVQ